MPGRSELDDVPADGLDDMPLLDPPAEGVEDMLPLDPAGGVDDMPPLGVDVLGDEPGVLDVLGEPDVLGESDVLGEPDVLGVLGEVIGPRAVSAVPGLVVPAPVVPGEAAGLVARVCASLLHASKSA